MIVDLENVIGLAFTEFTTIIARVTGVGSTSVAVKLTFIEPTPITAFIMLR